MNSHRDQSQNEPAEPASLDFVDRNGVRLSGVLYRPAGTGPFPTVIAIHGGGWQRAQVANYRHLAPHLAGQGYAVFVPTYRLAKDGAPSYPSAVHDVRACGAVHQGAGQDLNLDPERLALLGDSSGAHLAALVALAGDMPLFTGNSPNGDLDRHNSSVKAAITVGGIFDLAAQWQHDQITRFDDHIVERFLGERLVDDRRPYFDASPLSYVSSRRNKTAFLVAWGTGDDVVEPTDQSVPFVLALKQAGTFVRTVPVQSASHYWISDPLDEPGSFSGFFANHLVRFLGARL